MTDKKELFEEKIKEIFEDVGLSVSFLKEKKSDEEVEKEIEDLFPVKNGKRNETKEESIIRQGWQCPKCGAILSPDKEYCPFCTEQTVSSFTCGGNNILGIATSATSLEKKK